MIGMNMTSRVCSSIRTRIFKDGLHSCSASDKVLYKQAIHRSFAQAGAKQELQTDRSEHNQRQVEAFHSPDVLKWFTAPLPPEIEQRLLTIVGAVPGLGEASRVIDVGSGTGCLIPHMQARGVKDILAVDLSPTMLKELEASYVRVGTLGNDLGVRAWQGDMLDLPAYQGPADAFFFNAVFGNMHSQRAALLKAALMLRPGGHIVISHPMGRAWHCKLHADQPDMVPHELPTQQQLQELVSDLPLQVVAFTDEPELYLACLQVPLRYHFPGAPKYLGGKVVTGFGRGSKQMGIPTANIDPEPLKETLQSMPRGVYFGWAQLAAPSSWPEADGQVHKVVLNIGRRPTVNSNDDVTVECHILHPYSADFYGQQLRVVVLGYIRPEMKFLSLPELIARIKADTATARLQLDDPTLSSLKQDAYLFS